MEVIINIEDDNGSEEIYGKTYACPNPDCIIDFGDFLIMEGMKYCPNCGSKIKWEISK